jgi:hypothetical protein
MDNERPIEKLLRRYAKKRRDDPAATGLELHPATRRMLQGEVSRQFPKPAAGGMKSVLGLKSLWPRLVWALPVLVVVGVGVWAIVESQKSRRGAVNLAKMEPASVAQSRESLTLNETPAQPFGGVTPSNEIVAGTLAYAVSSPAKDGTTALGLEREKLKADDAPASLALNTPAPSIAVPAPEVANLDKTIQEKAVAGRDVLERLARDARADKSRDLTLTARRASAEEAASLGEKVETVRALPATPTDNFGFAPSLGGKGGTAGLNRAGKSLSATPPPAGAPPLSLSTKSSPARVEYDRAQVAPPTVVQKFVQTTAVSTSGSLAKKSAETPPVLDAFQVEQTGNQLRVIDSDGSSYVGSIEVAPTQAPLYSSSLRKKADDSKDAKLFRSPVSEKALEVQAGQNYFFRVAGTNRTLKQPVAFSGNLLPAAQTTLTLSPKAKDQFPKAQTSSPTLLNSSISGKVKLGADKEMQINAVPVPP